MASLRYLDDDGRVTIKNLDAEHFVIGRAETANLTFDSDMISREHVRIDLEKDGRFRIRDLGSRNKTHVNGELITETLLGPGDIIRAGDRIVEFIDDAAGPERLDAEFLTPDRGDPPNCEWVKPKAPLSLTVAQMERIAQLGGDFPLTARAEDIAAAAMGQLILAVEAERGFVALRGEAKDEIRPIAHRGLARSPGGSRMPVSQSFAVAPLLQGVAGRYPQTTGQVDGKLGYAAAALIAPLVYRGECIGVLYVDRPGGRRPFAAAALQFVIAAGAFLGASLGEATRSLTRNAPREGLAWMTTIRRMQTALTIPVSSNDTFEAASKCLPGRARCGDFVHWIEIDEQRCGVLMIDGGGHGVNGIAQASAIQSAVRVALGLDDAAVVDPAAMFNAVNRMVAQSAARQILPCVYVGLDVAAGKAAYINAGCQPPLLMVAPARLVTLDQPSLVLGVDPDYLYESTRVDLPGAFRLVCVTDGFVESTNSGGEAFGDQRLHEALLDPAAFAPAGDVVARLSKAWSAHLAGSQADDDASVIAVAHG
jgi:GAF domain-containing protein